MIRVLVNTTYWVDLLTNEGVEKGLRILEHCVAKKQISLLGPQRLREEWERNKGRHISETRKSINVGFGGYERTTQKQLKREIERLEAKAKRIEVLLLSGKTCLATKAVHAEVGDRRSKSLASYHHSPISDGYMSGFQNKVLPLKSRILFP